MAGIIGISCSKENVVPEQQLRKIRLVIKAKNFIECKWGQSKGNEGCNMINKYYPSKYKEIKIDTTMNVLTGNSVCVILELNDNPEYKLEGLIEIYKNDTLVRSFEGYPSYNYGYHVK